MIPKRWFKIVCRYAAGSNTEFTDYSNSDLIPGIDMSGGYGLFHQGERFPAHIHDCDESICIIQGNAICNGEGGRYAMADCLTALQPRGRIHYFINESPEQMAMLWVYAAPLSERIIIDETLTQPDADLRQENF